MIINNLLFILSFCFLIESKIAAQSMPFTNSLTCAVVVGYEIWDPSCGNCGFGTLTVPSKSTVNLPLCNTTWDICVWIISIGGNLVAANHESYGFCHILIPFCTNGTNCNINWNSMLILPPFNGWIIQ